MSLLLHLRKQKAEKFLRQFKRLHQLYVKKDNLFSELITVLGKDCIQFFEDIQAVEQASKIRIIQTTYFTALNGINPISLEHVIRNRRKMQWSFAYQSLASFEEIIQNYVIETKKEINEAESVIGKILMASFQNNLVDLNLLKSISTQGEVEIVWTKIVANAQLNIFYRQLLLKINKIDILMIAERLIKRLQIE